MESVKQGSCCLGICAKDFAVVAALKRATNELSSHQKKIFEIDSHIACAISGLTADAHALISYMRTECLEHKFQYDSAVKTSRLVTEVADKHQVKTQQSWTRPYGVGLLVIGSDADGAHLYQTCPSGNYYEYKAVAIGSRSQSAKSYLEKHLAEFREGSLDDIVMHALKALQGPANDKNLDGLNTSVAIVGKDKSFTRLTGEDLQPYLSRLTVANEDDMEEDGNEDDDDDDDENDE